MPRELDLPAVIHDVRTSLDDEDADVSDVSLGAVAARAGWSKFHLHREFHRRVGETPKRYALRLRLERAAAHLVTTDASVVAIALEHGFASHEVFTRAFRRQFAQPPTGYRAAALEGRTSAERARHAGVVHATGPCIGLLHQPSTQRFRRSAMTALAVERRELTPQPILFVRKRVARHEVANAIGECLGQVFPHCMKKGLALAGPPFARYSNPSPGLFTIEVGMPLAAPGEGEGEIQTGTLASGLVAYAVHIGAYDRLGESYAAMERWIDANGLRTAGAPWESYVTDPADYPDSNDWRTEIYWPIASA